MPCEDGLSVRRVQRKRCHLVGWEQCVSITWAAWARRDGGLDKLAKPHCSGLLISVHHSVLILCAYRKLSPQCQKEMGGKSGGMLSYCLWKNGMMPRPRKTKYKPRGAATAMMPERSAGCSGTVMVDLGSLQVKEELHATKRNQSKRGRESIPRHPRSAAPRHGQSSALSPRPEVESDVRYATLSQAQIPLPGSDLLCDARGWRRPGKYLC